MRVLALLLVLALGTTRAWAAEPPMQPEARARYEEAMNLYAARAYRAAIAAFEAAYALDPRREILFAQAQATRLSGDCINALPLYQRFLATNPPPQQVEATRIAVARCEAAASTATGPPRAPAPPPPIVTVPPPLPPPPRWYQDRLGGALAGVGAVGVGAGVALLASARTADADAHAATRYDDYQAQRARAERRWAWGLGTLIAGSALVATGIGRYVWVAAHPRGGVIGAGARF